MQVPVEMMKVYQKMAKEDHTKRFIRYVTIIERQGEPHMIRLMEDGKIQLYIKDDRLQSYIMDGASWKIIGNLD